MIETITTNSWFPIVGFAITVASVILTIVFYIKSRRFKKACYIVNKQVVIENSIPILPGLTVQYNGIIQDNISIAKVFFWNQGVETIENEDIAEAKPLSIFLDNEGKLLNTEITTITDPANKFTVESINIDEHGITAIKLGFDFLDQGDGALIQLVYSGSFTTKVWLSGKIKGTKKIENSRVFINSPNDSVNSKIIQIVVAILGIGFGYLLINPNSRLTGVLVSIYGILIIIFSLIMLVTNFISSTPPQKLVLGNKRYPHFPISKYPSIPQHLE